MPLERDYSSKIQSLFQKVNIYEDVRSFLVSIKDLHYPLLLLYAALFCLSEIHNGGFLQLFWNSSGVLLPEAVEGYRALGMPKLAATFTSAAALLGLPYPRDIGERRDALLKASMYTEDELTRIFEGTENLYLREATANLAMGALNHEAWELARSENSGFQERDFIYAATLAPEHNVN